MGWSVGAFVKTDVADGMDGAILKITLVSMVAANSKYLSDRLVLFRMIFLLEIT